MDFLTLREIFLSTIPPLLVHTPILRTLAELQRSLDVLDIEGLSKLWALSHIQSPSETPSVRVPPIGSTSPQPTMSEWTNFVNEYLSTDRTRDHAHPKVSDLRYYLLAYLLSATFKDCSIILRVNTSGDARATGGMKANSVAMIDLDPKCIDRLNRWEQLDRNIVKSYTGVGPKLCVDGQNRN